MSRGIHCRGESIRSIDGSVITNTYKPLLTPNNVAEFEHLIRQLIITNTTNGYLLVSFDPLVDQLRLIPGQAVFFDFTTNKAGSKDGFFLGMGDAVWVKQSSALFATDTDATSGFITASAYYADGDGN